MLICHYSNGKNNTYLYSISNDDDYEDGAYKFITYEDVYELRSGNFTSVRSVLEPTTDYYSLRPSFIKLTTPMINIEKQTIEVMRGNDFYKKYQKLYGSPNTEYIIYLDVDYKSIFESLERQNVIDSIISIYE